MYRTVAQLDYLTSLLASGFPQYFTRYQLPEASVEGRPVYVLRMRAGGGGERRGVLLVGGTHARELMNPDAIVELAVDLLSSYENGGDITYGKRTWPAYDVKVLLESLDLWLLPCLNPDGREYVMTVDDMWRKNRRNNKGSKCVGVDLNRNLDVVWGVTQGSTSCDPCQAVFCGPSAFSEPETRNVKHLLDTRQIDCFADVHSYSELILHPWGHAPTQTTDQSQRFTNLPTGTCTTIGQAGYQEYMLPRDLLRFETVGDRIVTAIRDVRGRMYTRQTSFALYATTGTHSDYVYSRHIADPSLRKTYGYTFETGPWAGSAAESFHPADPKAVKTDAKSGMLALAQQCICAIELIGERFFGHEVRMAPLRDVRDERLGSTKAGRQWITLFERVQTPLVGVLLADEDLAREAADLIAIAARMADDDEATLDDEVVERGLALVRRLRETSEAEDVQYGLDAVAEQLERLRGVRAQEAIETLMTRGPRLPRKRPEG